MKIRRFGCVLYLLCVTTLLMSCAYRENSDSTERQTGGDTNVRHAMPSGTVKQSGRLAWLLEQRLYPDRMLPVGAMAAARAQVRNLPHSWALDNMVRLKPHAQVPDMMLVFGNALGAWRSLGPAPIVRQYRTSSGSSVYPVTGRVTAVAAHPFDADTLYIGSAGGGIWKTIDGGMVWVPLFDAMPSLVVNAIAVDPHDPNTVYVGTGSDYAGSGYAAMGLFVSRNAGATWKKIGGRALDGCVIYRIATHPQRPGHVLVAAGTVSTVQFDWPQSCNMGVYQSANGGETWTRSLAGKNVLDVAYGGEQWQSAFAGVFGEGLFRSDDVASSWVLVTEGLPAADLSVIKIAAAPSRPARVYVAMGLPPTEPNYIKGVWSSDDGGMTWSGGNILPDVVYTFLNLLVSPGDPDQVYLGAVHLRASVDGARSFNNIHPNEVHVDIPALAFDASGNLVLGTDGGPYRRSAAAPPGYENLNTNLSITQIYPGISGSLVANPADATLAGGSQDNGPLLRDGSGTWLAMDGGDGGATGMDPVDPRYMYYCLYNARRTYPGPWCRARRLLPGTFDVQDPLVSDAMKQERSESFPPLVLDTSHPDRLYIGAERVWRTSAVRSPKIPTDSWQPLGTAFTDGSRQLTVQTIAPAASDERVVYAGLCGHLIVTRTDGQTWMDTIDNGLPDRCVTDIAVHPQRAGQAYASVSGFGAGHVFFTHDFGATWTDISGSLPDTPVNAIAIDPESSPPLVFVGTDVGVFVSPDNGLRWGRTGKGLPNTIVTDLLYDTASDELVVATFGRGMWAAPVWRFQSLIARAGATTAAAAYRLEARRFAESGIRPDGRK